MNFIEEFIARGFYHQATDLDALTELTSKQKISAYIGFDPTASSLHVGNLMQIMIFKLLQKHGHRPIVIVGGGTVKVGDPSGKDEMRKILSDQDILNNMNGIKHCLAKYIKFGDQENRLFVEPASGRRFAGDSERKTGMYNEVHEDLSTESTQKSPAEVELYKKSNEAIMLNNDLWLNKLNYLEFLRDYGKHFSINRMLKFDSVKLRLDREQNLSFLEFNYMILQAYDFVELNRRYKCKLQLGGSDQWGNIVSGVELNRRLGFEEVFGLTTPLITTASGAKMGKSANGAVWLNEDLLSPYDYYQFWRNTDDRDVIKFMKLFTELPIDKIDEYSKMQGSEINEVKKILAFEATKLCHGEDKATKAAATAVKMFEEKSLSENLPTIELSKNELSQGLTAYVILHKAGLTESGGEARRLIRGKGAKINDQTIEDENQIINLSFCNQDGIIKLSAGKKRHALVKSI